MGCEETQALYVLTEPECASHILYLTHQGQQRVSLLTCYCSGLDWRYHGRLEISSEEVVSYSACDISQDQ